MFTTLIFPELLFPRLDNPGLVIVDCRFNLSDTEAGRVAYEKAHIPGAVYAHLDNDLSSTPVTDHGRHPLPAPEALRALFSRLGIGNHTQVVAYDAGGGMIAARLWWMLRYMGHEAVAVLDGGWTAWRKSKFPARSGVETNAPAVFSGQPRREMLVLLDEVPTAGLLLDARAGPRYRGEAEPLDPRAGHIPGAVNYYYGDNLDERGKFRPPEQLRAQLAAVIGETPAGEVATTVVHYCGSGVSACHNLLAQVHAGLPEGRLYVGSWSEWSSDPNRPGAP